MKTYRTSVIQQIFLSPFGPKTLYFEPKKLGYLPVIILHDMQTPYVFIDLFSTLLRLSLCKAWSRETQKFLNLFSTFLLLLVKDTFQWHKQMGYPLFNFNFNFFLLLKIFNQNSNLVFGLLKALVNLS